MEVKGVVDEPPGIDDEARKKENLDARERSGKKAVKECEGMKGLPHQLVPQQGDFSTQALENL